MKALIFICFTVCIPFCGSSKDFKPVKDSLIIIHQTDSLAQLANYYSENEQYEKSLQQMYKCIEIFQQTGDISKQIFYYGRVIGLFISIRNYELAEKYLGIISELATKTSDLSAKTRVFYIYGNYYLAIKDYDLALRSLYFSIAVLSKTRNLKLEGFIFKSLGDVYVQKKQYDLAAYLYKKAITAFSDEPNLLELSVLYTRIAHISYRLGNYRQNLAFNKKALVIRKKIGKPDLVSSSYLNVGEAYWLLGRDDLVLPYYNKSLEVALGINQALYQEVVYRLLKDYAIYEGRYKDAYDYFQKCVEYKIKLSLEKNRSETLILEANQSINESETQNELTKQKILIQNLQIKNRKIQTLGFEATFLGFLTLIFVIDLLTRSNQRRKHRFNELNEQLVQEIKDNIEAKNLLQQSEELHRFLAENTTDSISLLKADLSRLYISNSCEKLYGFTVEEIMKNKSPLDLVETSFQANVNQKIIEMLHLKKPIRYYYKAIRKNGSSFWAEAILNPILDLSTGSVEEIITVVRDFSENKRFEEELSENARQKEFLLREIHNRVKNNFAILGSLMDMLRDEASDLKLSSSLTDLKLRIRTMSLVHEQLYKSQEINTIPFDTYLQHLCLIISNSFSDNRIEIITEISECTLSIEMTLPVGLIINELLTNAYKYAFPGSLSGIITVSLLPAENEKYCISVCDNGIGLPENFTMENSATMGSKIISLLVQQVEGKLSVSNENGACFHLEFPTNMKK
ncbi:MAG: DUF2225 domain-containing protein [Bacteroidetes bacterium]|nr:DUF2225 domain-containing protein [Bacteroidota bacterium]